jgi:hypothetical protein
MPLVSNKCGNKCLRKRTVNFTLGVNPDYVFLYLRLVNNKSGKAYSNEVRKFVLCYIG